MPVISLNCPNCGAPQPETLKGARFWLCPSCRSALHYVEPNKVKIEGRIEGMGIICPNCGQVNPDEKEVFYCRNCGDPTRFQCPYCAAPTDILINVHMNPNWTHPIGTQFCPKFGLEIDLRKPTEELEKIRNSPPRRVTIEDYLAKQKERRK